MNSQSQAKSPERLRAMVAGTLANFQHPTLKHNLTALKALHHVAWLDDTVHIELQMPFVWSSAFEVLKEQCSAELLRITGAKAIDWKLTHSIATLKRVKNQPGVNGVKNIIAISISCALKKPPKLLLISLPSPSSLLPKPGGS